jgi:3-hydroxyisobutyrate dehydrogenase-like beta-hydroxyacid dehydrogenase
LIGFIGLGIMGSRMAGNLLKGGHELIIYNRTKEKAKSLLSKGAKWASSPQEAASKSELIFTMLASPQAVESVALGAEGFLNHLSEGSLWIDCSTVDPSFTKKMAAEAAKRKIRFLDAPVTGSRIPAEKGELVFLVGGNEAVLEQVKPLLNLMGKDVLYQGETGKGSAMKLVINLMLAQSMAVFSEAVNLAEALGLQRETVMDTLLNGPTAAPFLKGKREKMEHQDYSADFPLYLIQKDLQLVSQAAYESSLSLPIANVTKEIYAMAKQHGLGDSDFSAIYNFYQRVAKDDK